MGLSTEDMRQIYEGTVIVRRPTYGIVTGYHEIPYVCVGASLTTSSRTVRVNGTIHVSPRFIIRPEHLEPSYGEIFGDDNVDAALVGRMFGFMGFRGKPVECKSEHIEVKDLNESVDRVLSDALDDIERREDITSGVIVTPNPQYYPISLERFIASILEDEFRV